ncbi:hypothetical protein GYH30_009938 [Glycine max]|nr:hypothetical protein GYH30_009938 [Glycine max]
MRLDLISSTSSLSWSMWPHFWSGELSFSSPWDDS